MKWKLSVTLLVGFIIVVGGLAYRHFRDEPGWRVLGNVPPASPQYATAQRLLGYNHYGKDLGDWEEAKRHVDLALKAAPSDPKVLEDAGRVYVRVGLVSEGETMLKAANTPLAIRFLAARHGT